MNENFGKKTLRRSRDQRLLTGVCGGIGEFLGVDPNIVRLVFAVLTLMGGGIFVYIIAWLVMPEEGGRSSVLEHIVRNFQGKKSEL
ncbi:PspC domain-containing protein [Streptomonospora nanhaiensis]|uniref:Phage shock protein PspC (Stress-responsive transcriptional regulator) n=1 Tax=Streptomonospora nanhaiensis TaxID=1323731 RepID=A0A853BR79_9ACTN|nr:PspC domain-containing protein [Streptomonospora nanhaiensis]MBV2362184.1 PspC domain-containing protein [Streptomonospora nanhaiensis]MBX9388167.1 PspC domain-containing protein [Streptomonospora nanhaiensis]NYI97364.1 phage shock protein PspC (stress-responsive transcriptional regulator) [Streptomonospora nanhaiensis]